MSTDRSIRLHAVEIRHKVSPCVKLHAVEGLAKRQSEKFAQTQDKNSSDDLHRTAECSLRTHQSSANASKLVCGSEARPGPAVLVNRSEGSDWLEVRQEFVSPRPLLLLLLLLVAGLEARRRFPVRDDAQTHARNRYRGRGTGPWRTERKEVKNAAKDKERSDSPALCVGAFLFSLSL